jgi:acetoin utilization protein AcuB
MTASEFISESITFATLDFTGERILTLMNIFQVKHLPVIDEQGKLLGIVSDDDILVRNFNETLESFNLDLQEVHVSPDQHIFDIIHILSKQDISLIPIVKEGIYKGSIRKQDVISFLGNGFSFSFPGSIIELGIQKNNYSLVEISQIVEAENAKILSVFIRETTNEESKLKVILKINKNNISKIIAAFERYEYEINASYTENNEYDDFLKERYDSLMRYLNI